MYCSKLYLIINMYMYYCIMYMTWESCKPWHYSHSYYYYVLCRTFCCCRQPQQPPCIMYVFFLLYYYLYLYIPIMPYMYYNIIYYYMYILLLIITISFYIIIMLSYIILLSSVDGSDRMTRPRPSPHGLAPAPPPAPPQDPDRDVFPGRRPTPIILTLLVAPLMCEETHPGFPRNCYYCVYCCQYWWPRPGCYPIAVPQHTHICIRKVSVLIPWCYGCDDGVTFTYSHTVTPAVAAFPPVLFPIWWWCCRPLIMARFCYVLMMVVWWWPHPAHSHPTCPTLCYSLTNWSY